MGHNEMTLKLGMYFPKNGGNKGNAGRVPCFFQYPLFRPKEYIPTHMRYGKGDCTTCTMCRDNRDCSGYEPHGVEK